MSMYDLLKRFGGAALEGIAKEGERLAKEIKKDLEDNPQAQRVEVEVLPGWTCQRCQGFNGDAKERRLACRACGNPRPGT